MTRDAIMTYAVAAILAAVASLTATAEPYDFFANAIYPGAGRKPGVGLYKVKQAGGDNPESYGRREVDWWPRKGVDIIELKDAMPLRTWTLREREMDPSAAGEHLILGIEAINRRVAWNWPRRFKAHLVGFRGIGNRYGNPFEPAPFFCPAVVLLLEDGTKRCFTKGTFVEQDEKFILDLYLKEIDRLRETLSNEEHKLSSGIISGWPNNAKPGQPGTMRVESRHFVWVSGSQHAPNENYSPWVNRFEPEKARLYREGSVTFAEDMWAYQEHAGVLMPFWDRHELNKYAITVCGTYRDGHKWLGGYAGGGGGGCAVKYAGGGPWGLTMGHEWGHGLSVGTRVDGGGGEILADTCQVINDPASPTFYNNAKRPWRNCVHGSYGTGLFYAIMGQDPNWGYTVSITLPVGRSEQSIFHTLARVGRQRGLFANGVRGVGDMMGEFAARQAEFDCELQENLRRDYISVKRNYLEAVDREAGLYRIPWGESPEAFGANIIRLVPEKGVEKITVDFRGFYDAATHGDWRVCIVVTGADGKVRYSPLWNKGAMEMAIKPTDRRFWLTVAATPSALLSTTGRSGIGMLLNGRHAYRYPYEVRLTACRPGTPHNLPGDVEDYGLSYLGGFRDRFNGGVCVIPHPSDTPEAEILSRTVAPLRAKVEEVEEETNRLVAADKIDVYHWRYLRRFVPHLSFLDNYVNWMLDGVKGHRHPNGGGWVSASSEVAPTAYVAPDAMVLYGAKVLDHAAIEDYAIVRGPGAVVSGHAKVSGQAYVAGDVKIGGYTRVVHPIIADGGKTAAIGSYVRVMKPTSADGKHVVPNEVPLRPFQEKGDGKKLWANYAMDANETEVLEDWFRYKDDRSARLLFYVLNLNGHLYGKPKFVVDGQRRGFAFDGRTQYAEASPILADLGQVTVDIGLKWEGGGNQAVFDFGTSTANRFVLTPLGKSGKAELSVTRAGKTDRIVADAALPKNKWAKCRVEINGKKISLWIDGRKAAQKDSGFRPADVYPAGIEKRNFIAAARDATGHFRGSLDYLRVYYAVYDDFTKAPAPRRHAPRRVTREFIDTCSREYHGVDAKRAALIKEKTKPMYAYYDQVSKRMAKLINEIEYSNAEAVAEANRKLEGSRKKQAERTRELRAEFDKLPETIKKQAEYRKFESKIRQLDTQRREAAKAVEDRYRAENKEAIEAEKKQKRAGARISGRTHAEKLRSLVAIDPKIAGLVSETNKLRSRARMHRPDSRDYIAGRTVELKRQVARASMGVGEAIKKNAAEFKPEYDWLKTLSWLAFSSHYNYPYRSYFEKEVAKTIGGKVNHENFGSLESLLSAQTTATWHTQCDWDWRLKWEIDGSIEDLPRLRKWLERARGPVQTENPAVESSGQLAVDSGRTDPTDQSAGAAGRGGTAHDNTSNNTCHANAVDGMYPTRAGCRQCGRIEVTQSSELDGAGNRNAAEAHSCR